MKKISVLIFLLFLISFASFVSGQSLKNDTLFTEISKINNPVKRIDRLNSEIEKMWRFGDYFRGLEFTKETLRIAKKHKYQRGISDALSNEGIIYDYQGKYTDAIHIYFQALKMQIKQKDQKEISKTYNNLGLVYENQGNYKSALEYYSKAMVICKKNKDIRGISVAVNNIGIIYMHEKKYDLALKNYYHCIEVEKKINDTIAISDSYNNIALIYLEQNKYDQAEKYFLKSLDIRTQQKDSHGICNSLNNIATLAYKKNDYLKAKTYFLKAASIAKKMGLKKSSGYAYDNLADVAEKLHDTKGELAYYKLFITYKDSIDNESNTKKQTQDEMQYVFDQKIAEEKLMDHKKDLATAHEKHKQKVILWSVSIIAILTFIFLFFIFKRWRFAQNQNKIIAQQKALVIEKNRIVEKKNQEILDSITYAKRIQTAILPPDRLVKEYLVNSFILYKPKDIVAGDFYWIEPSHNQIIFAVADCTGHGVPGAMVSVVCHNALNRSVREFGLICPGEILDKTRDIIVSEFEKSDDNVTDGMDISLCNLDLDKMVLKWSGANNPLWLLKKGENEITEIKPNKQPIGKYFTYPSFQTHTIKIEKGDSIYLFTDGFADQFGGEDEKKFKSKKMKELIVSIKNEPMIKQRTIFDNTFEKWKGNQEQVDDVCIIGIQI